MIANPGTMITTSPECELHDCRFCTAIGLTGEIYDEQNQKPALPIEQSHVQTRRLPMLWLIAWWFLLLGWWFLLLRWRRRFALRLGRRALLSRRVGRLRMWLRSWLGFRLRCRPWLRGVRAGRGGWVSAGRARQGGACT